MPKSRSPADRVSDILAAISTAADALFKHTTKAISINERANRAAELVVHAIQELVPMSSSNNEFR